MELVICTPCYNHGKYLREAIESVLSQSFEDFEYILVNDGSTDNSLDIMFEFATQDKRIKVIDLPKQPNKAYALNKTIGINGYKYWLWCPADDKLKVDCVKNKLQNTTIEPSVLYNYSFDVIDPENKLLRTTHIKHKTIEEFWKHVWTSCEIGFTGALFDCRVFNRVGKFPEHENISEDFYWMIMACIFKVPFIGIEDNQHYKRKNPESVTARNIDQIAANTKRIRKELCERFSVGVKIN